tara:strand:- start:564 stop:821 length:258 start_codon:yes stop_codon:yes gene_type:complete
MNNISILSIKHFVAYNQVVEDYKTLIIYERELSLCHNRKKKANYDRIRDEIIFLLQRIIDNKNILKENTSADQEYLITCTNVKLI